MSRGEPKAKRRERLARTAAGLPRQPGTYLFLDAAGRVLYVGKAKSLRARVRTYFGNPADLAPKVERTVDATHEIDFIVTGPGEGWTVDRVEVIAEDEASDHRPVVAVLRLPLD